MKLVLKFVWKIYVFGVLPVLFIGKVWSDNKDCGVKAAYGAVSALGIKPKLTFADLLTAEYISQRSGSTAIDVCKAVGALGGEARYLQGMGWPSLVDSSFPLILHVASDGQLQSANHWILYLGMDGSEARVVNSSGIVELWPMERLLVRWRGRGIVVAPKEHGTQAKHLLNRAELFWLGGLLVGAFSLAKLGDASLNRIRAWKYPITLSIITLFIATFSALGSRARPLLPINATSRYAQAALSGAQHEYIDWHSFKQLLNAPGETVLVDCRYKADYDFAPIPNTVSIPIDAEIGEIERALHGRQASDPIVLFCMSSKCQFSEVMTIRLTAMGFRNLSVWKGGYREWASKNLQEESDR